MRPDQPDRFRYRNLVPDRLFGTRRMMIAVSLIVIQAQTPKAGVAWG